MRFGKLLVLLVAVSACSSEAPPKPKTYYPPSVKKYAPEPVYNRLRNVYLPSPLPARSSGEETMAKGENSGLRAQLDRKMGLDPILAFDFKNSTLEEIAKKISNSIGYQYYCSSLLAKRRVSISLKGTADEIAQDLAKREKIVTVVDHSNKEVRFIARDDENIQGS